ncbi:hypothetical protein AN220_03535, partial [Streptomyces nanshensis]
MLAGQRVEDDVHAAVAALGRERGGVAGVARGADQRGGHAHGLHLGVLGGRRGGEHVGAQVVGEPHRGAAHPARGGVHQHRLAGPQSGQLDQSVVGGQVRHGGGGGLRPGPAGRDAPHGPRVGHADRSDAAGQQAEHPVADGQCGDAGADLGDHTGALGAEHQVAGVHAQRPQHVAEVERGGADGDPHLSGGERPDGVRGGYQCQILQGAGRGGIQPPGRGAGHLQARVVGGPHQPRHQHPAAAHREVELVGGERRLDRG